MNEFFVALQNTFDFANLQKIRNESLKIFCPNSHVNGHAPEEEEEETEEDLELEDEEEIPAKPLKVENNMNARRWKWEVLDD